ncbi:MAG: hypothetical protein ABI743_07390, partial [bacterium]
VQTSTTLATEITALKAELVELQRRLSAQEQRWPSVDPADLEQRTNVILQGLDAQIGVRLAEKHKSAGAESGADDPVKVIHYLAKRASLLDGTGANTPFLPMVLDDPLRFWDDEALASGLPPVQTLARAGRQLLVITSRAALLSAWRATARAQGGVLTVIELGHGPSRAASTVV